MVVVVKLTQEVVLAHTESGSQNGWGETWLMSREIKLLQNRATNTREYVGINEMLSEWNTYLNYLIEGNFIEYYITKLNSSKWSITTSGHAIPMKW